MARAGILYSHVAQAAAGLAAEGRNPTVDSVREALGDTGSKSTIAPLLKRWKTEHQDTVAAAESGLPASLLQAVKGLHQHMQAEFMQQREQAARQHAEELRGAAEREEQLRTELQSALKTNAALTEELAQARQALAQMQAAQHAQSLTLASAQAENTGLQRRLEDRATEIATIDHQLTQTRAQFEHYQEATAAQRAQERQSYEQRIGRLEQELAAASRHIAAQQTAIGQHETRAAHLTAEHERKEQALQAAQEELMAARSARESLADRLREAIAAKEDLITQTAAARDQLSEARAALAAQERATGMLTEQLHRAEQRADHLSEEKLAWLQERGALTQRLLFAEQGIAEPGGPDIQA
jgi:chromosome segregation ATPase